MGEHSRGEIFVINQVTKDVTDKTICASSIKRLPAPSTCIVHTYLQAREREGGHIARRQSASSDFDSWTSVDHWHRVEDEGGSFTKVSRSASVTQIMSMDASESSSCSSSKIEREDTASIATNGLRLSILGFAASTLYAFESINELRQSVYHRGTEQNHKREAQAEEGWRYQWQRQKTARISRRFAPA